MTRPPPLADGIFGRDAVDALAAGHDDRFGGGAFSEDLGTTVDDDIIQTRIAVNRHTRFDG